MHYHRHHARSGCRRGAAAVEFAIALPVLTMIIFGSIEASQAVFLRQKLTQAAYEGALTGMKAGASSADVVARVDAVCTARGIQSAAATAGAGGTPLEALAAGQDFHVRVTAPAGPNIVGPTMFFSNNIVVDLCGRLP